MSGVSKGSQDSRSSISAAEHVGKHSDGVTGWRLLTGSGGICICRVDSTEALGDGVELFAQAALRSASAITHRPPAMAGAD